VIVRSAPRYWNRRYRAAYRPRVTVPWMPRGDRLDADAYAADLARQPVAPWWALDRRQDRRLPGQPGRAALAAGRWEEAVLLLPPVERFPAARYRLRVVELPPTPYLQWELYGLRARAAAGEQVTVIDATATVSWEPLPDLLVVGDNLVYELRYDGSGAPAGAVRHRDPTLVEHCRELIRVLSARGEDLPTFFAREIEPLPPPRAG
jgi:hypothetical protein